MGIRKPRPGYDPDMPEHAVCPGCALRLGGLVAADCPVCDGTGVIALGRPALYYDPPEIVATAVVVALTAGVDHAHRTTSRLDTHRAAIPKTLARLRDLGVIDTDPGGTR